MLSIFISPIVKIAKSVVIHDNISTTIGALVSFLGTSIVYFIGGYDYSISLLVMFVVLDYITGLLAAIKRKEISSDVMYWGMIRKIFQFVVVGIGASLDILLGNEAFVIRLLVIYYYIGMEGISLLENMVLLGVKVPQKLIDVLEQIKKEKTTNREIRDEINNNLSDFSVKKKLKKKDRQDEED